MFPCFCVAPTDLAAAFGTLAPVLANAMQDTRYPDLLPEVTNGNATAFVTDSSSMNDD
jgi:hypothetical protein